jgi:hypothetical protein
MHSEDREKGLEEPGQNMETFPLHATTIEKRAEVWDKLVAAR